jgi:MoaA/NifB/PqqE/SkfB family radical SAM enzyme
MPTSLSQRNQASRFKRIAHHFQLYMRLLWVGLGRVPLAQLIRTQFPFLLPDAKVPPLVALELTNICNLRCVYCPSPLKLRPQGAMDEPTFARLIEQIREALVPRLVAVGNGEPTLHPHFAAYAKRLREVVPYLSLTSNWQNVDDALIDTVLGVPFDVINISVDGVDAATYEATRIGGSFDRLRHNVERLWQRKKTLNSPTLIAIRVMLKPSEKNRERQVMAYWQAIADVVSPQFVLNFRGSLNDAYEPVLNENARCIMPLKTLDVHWNGNVPLCSYSDIQTGNPLGLVLGNIRDSTLTALWNGPLMRQYRQGHRHRDPAMTPICKGCRGKT